MRTLALRRHRLLRLVIFCFLTMIAAMSIAVAQHPLRLENSRVFWVSSRRPTPPAYRQVHASLRASGHRSLIYVEDSLWGKSVNPDNINRMHWRLESALPAGAIVDDMGMVPYQESVFGPLPKKFHGGDDRLIVLYTELAAGKLNHLDGSFSVYDQIPDAEARAKYGQRSNEANIIYLNGLSRNEELTAGVAAHALQRLLAKGNSVSEREFWLSETLAEGAMLLTGNFTNQPAVRDLARNPGLYPLVSFGLPSFGTQLLFSSFLLDSLAGYGTMPLAAISKGSEPGKAAVERLFLEQAGAPLSFDAVFSNYISYVFGHSLLGTNLPQAWAHDKGIVVPKIEPYFTYKSSSGELTGQMHPYTFLAIDLAQELSPQVLIQTERVQQKDQSDPYGCANSASVLWKPIAPTRIAVYAVGCDPKLAGEVVNFRLKILDQPSLIPTGSFKILR